MKSLTPREKPFHLLTQVLLKVKSVTPPTLLRFTRRNTTVPETFTQRNTLVVFVIQFFIPSFCEQKERTYYFELTKDT